MSLTTNWINSIFIQKALIGNLQYLFVATAFSMLQPDVFGQELQFEKALYDLGKVEYGSASERILTFRNSGTDTLFITSFPKTACGCDMAKIQGNKMKYAPNETGSLIYKFDTKGPRRYDNTITIRTNSNPTHSILRVKWEVLPESEEKIPYWKEIISDTLKPGTKQTRK